MCDTPLARAGERSRTALQEGLRQAAIPLGEISQSLLIVSIGGRQSLVIAALNPQPGRRASSICGRLLNARCPNARASGKTSGPLV
jgi:hypothetical protein